MSPRTVLLVVGVLALQLAFIASYLGAFHEPRPHRIPVAVVAPAGAPAGTAQTIAARLDALPGAPVSARVVADEAAARRLIDHRSVYGALVVGTGSQDTLLVASAAGAAATDALTTVVRGADLAQRRTLTVDDVRPVAKGDARGLSSFYLVVGWVVGGYLVAAILAISAGTRAANRRRAAIRLGALALYAVASGFGGALIVETILHALSGSFVPLWAFGTLLVFAVGATTFAFQTLFGVVGIGLAILLFVVLGNPSAGGAYPAELLPPFWRTIGPWLPTGAGTNAVRGIVYFDGAKAASSCYVLAGYALIGSAVTVAFSGVRRPAA